MLMSTTRQNNALEKKNIRESKIIKISLSLSLTHHHHHCISQIILKKGDEKLRTQQPKKKDTKKNQYCSVCLYSAMALRVECIHRLTSIHIN